MSVSTSKVVIVTPLPILPPAVTPKPVVPSNPRTCEPLLNPIVPIPVLNEPWMLSITKLFLSVIKPTEITAPLPFPRPNVPIPKVSPTAKFLPPSVRVTALITPLLTVTFPTAPVPSPVWVTIGTLEYVREAFEGV